MPSVVKKKKPVVTKEAVKRAAEKRGYEIRLFPPRNGEGHKEIHAIVSGPSFYPEARIDTRGKKLCVSCGLFQWPVPSNATTAEIMNLVKHAKSAAQDEDQRAESIVRWAQQLIDSDDPLKEFKQVVNDLSDDEFQSVKEACAKEAAELYKLAEVFQSLATWGDDDEDE